MSPWARFFGRRKRMMEDLDQDIRDFIERETQDNIERGMAPEEARYAALRKFGNVLLKRWPMHNYGPQQPPHPGGVGAGLALPSSAQHRGRGRQAVPLHPVRGYQAD